MQDGELWQTLRVGDQVRIVQMPPEYSRPDSLHVDTRSIYQYLIDTGLVLTVAKVDEWDCPWVDFEHLDDDGVMGYHSLMLNHGGLAVVSP